MTGNLFHTQFDFANLLISIIRKLLENSSEKKPWGYVGGSYYMPMLTSSRIRYIRTTTSCVIVWNKYNLTQPACHDQLCFFSWFIDFCFEFCCEVLWNKIVKTDDIVQISQYKGITKSVRTVSLIYQAL